MGHGESAVARPTVATAAEMVAGPVGLDIFLRGPPVPERYLKPDEPIMYLTCGFESRTVADRFGPSGVWLPSAVVIVIQRCRPAAGDWLLAGRLVSAVRRVPGRAGGAAADFIGELPVPVEGSVKPGEYTPNRSPHQLADPGPHPALMGPAPGGRLGVQHLRRRQPYPLAAGLFCGGQDAAIGVPHASGIAHDESRHQSLQPPPLKIFK